MKSIVSNKIFIQEKRQKVVPGKIELGISISLHVNDLKTCKYINKSFIALEIISKILLSNTYVCIIVICKNKNRLSALYNFSLSSHADIVFSCTF